MTLGYFCALLLLVSSPSPATGAPATVDDRAERALEARIDDLLADILGEGRSRALVRSRAVPVPAEDPALPPRPREPALWREIRERIDKAPPVLPGFRAPRSMRKEALRSLKESAGAPPSATGAERMMTALTVSLVLDPGVGPEETEAATSAVAEALGLDSYRGDVVEVMRAPLRPTWRKALRSPGLLSNVVTAAVYALALFLVGLLLVPVLRLAHPSARRLSSKPGSWPGPVTTRRQADATARFLLGQHPEAAPWVLRRVGPGTAAEIFRRLPADRQRAAAEALLLRPPEHSRALRKFGKRLEEHLAAKRQGVELLEQILLRCPERTRRATLEHLVRLKPEFAGSLSAELPFLEDLAAGGEQALRVCLSPFSCEELALALYEMPEAVRRAFLDPLPPMIRDMVADKAEGLVPPSMDDVEAVRTRVLLRWKRLERGGRVPPLRPAGAAP